MVALGGQVKRPYAFARNNSSVSIAAIELVGRAESAGEPAELKHPHADSEICCPRIALLQLCAQPPDVPASEPTSPGGELCHAP